MRRLSTFVVAIAACAIGLPQTRIAPGPQSISNGSIDVSFSAVLAASGLDSGAPQVPPAAQQAVDVTGTAEVIFEDYRGRSGVRYAVNTGRERLAVNFTTNEPGWQSGDRVRLHGVRQGNTLSLNGQNAAVISTAVAAASGDRHTLVMLVNFQDNTAQPYTTAFVSDVVFNSVSNFDREVSQQQTWLSGDVAGWFTLPMSSTVCDTATLANLAKQAATNAGYTLTNYAHYVYAFPENACTWWGQGSVGGNPSQAWINGDLQVQVVAHEMGHNFGLYHSRSRDCGATVNSDPCTITEYGDTLDVMGSSSGHFNAFQKERLGWLAPQQIVNATASGLFTIEPYEATSSGVKAIKVLKSTDPTTGKRTFYYIEFRQNLGFDSFVGSLSNVLSGIVIHTGSESTGNSSYLLDLTPETSSWSDPALDVGDSYTDPDAGVTISTVSSSSAGASVSITMTGPACSQAAPSLTLSPATAPAVAPGTLVSYNVSVFNNDSPACTASTFALASSAAAGWTAALSFSPMSLAPGTSASETLNVTSPASTAAGSYAVQVLAANTTNPALSATAGATYVVAAPLTLQVSTDKAAYARGATINITAIVRSSAGPLGGAAVVFNIRKPDGQTIKGNATSDASGAARLKVRLRPKDPVGSYQVTGTATYGGQQATGTSTFLVQ